MSYTAASYNWNGEISFDNIPIPYNQVKVQYYNADNGDFVKPYLLHYDLYLGKSEDKMILRVPKLMPDSDIVPNPTGDEKVLEISDIAVKEPVIYLNGHGGDDSFDGMTPEKAVQTFGKAKALAAANQNIKQIIVIGTTSIQGDISLDGTNAIIVRGETFNGYLFRVASGNTASLSNIVVDGNVEKNTNIEKSLIEVNGNATLNIDSGTDLKNNQIKAIANTPTNGGAIFANSATINMSGGSIENNQATYGGGIHLNKSTMNFSGGTVQNNKSNLVIDSSVSPHQYYAAGGGILASEGSTVNMFADAKVLNNSSSEIGGGISLGSQQWGASNILNMTGGTIDGNTAGASGGGIFVQAKYFSGGASKAYIDGGYITNNKMDGTGKTDKAFGGGGIYVNGANKKYGVNGDNGELYLKNVIITDNSSELEGAGYAACPISKTKIYVTDGAAIFGNESVENSGNALYFLSSDYYGLHSGSAEYDLAKRMLGGSPYDWAYDNGTSLPDDKHKGILPSNSDLALKTDVEENLLARQLAKVFITGNSSATRGGGIGSNGSVTIGTEEKTSVSVEKKWVDNNRANPTFPESVTVKLIASIGNQEYEIESRLLNQENSWKTTFADLSTKAGGQDIKYSIKEVSVEGYTSEINGTAQNGFVVTNTKIPEKTSIQVTKAWEDKDNQDGKRPDSVTIKLLADGEETNKILTLTKENNWTGSFIDLDEYKDGKKIEYTVKEEAVGSGYTSVVTGSVEKGYVVTNVRTPNITPEKPNKTLPKTGDSSNPGLYVTLMGLSGLLLITIRVRNRRKKS